MVGQEVTWALQVGNRPANTKGLLLQIVRIKRVDGKGEQPQSFCLHGWEGI